MNRGHKFRVANWCRRIPGATLEEHTSQNSCAPFFAQKMTCVVTLGPKGVLMHANVDRSMNIGSELPSACCAYSPRSFFSEADPFASRQLVCDCWRGAACMTLLQWRRRSCPRTKKLESKTKTQRSLITRNSFKQLAVAAQGRLRGSHRLTLTVYRSTELGAVISG